MAEKVSSDLSHILFTDIQKADTNQKISLSLDALVLIGGFCAVYYGACKHIDKRIHIIKQTSNQLWLKSLEYKEPEPVIDDESKWLLQDTHTKMDEIQQRIDRWNIENITTNLPDSGSPQCTINPYDITIAPQSSSLKSVCCYRDINDPINNIGRPFMLSEKAALTLQRYLAAPVISQEDKKLEKHLVPQPVTAFSENHY